MRLALKLGSSIVVLALAGAVAAEVPDALLQEAAADYQAEHWAEAAAAYREIVEQDPASARGWMRLGIALRHLGRDDEALDAYGKAQAAGAPANLVAYEEAKLHAAAGRAPQALDALERAVADGYTNFEALNTDIELDALRSEPRFTQLAAQVRASAYPCEQPAEFHQFDFWKGDWVVTANGLHAGKNKISVREHGCLLMEEWQGASGSTGVSINYYDPAKHKWVQQWLSADGTLIHIEGGLRDGNMVLEGDAYYYGTGVRAPFRGTWTPLPDGRVRQYFEQSDDGGKTWNAWFDGYYAHP
jgi:tetratricopeptide (TPR) repeat protein